MKRALAALAALAIVAIAAALFGVFSRPKPLLERVTVIPGTDGWEQRVWLTDTQILLLHEGQGHNDRVVLLDRATGARRPMPELARALSRFDNEGLIPSPDAKWLLCLPFDGEEFVHVVSLDGKQVLQQSVAGNLGLAWAPGTQQWMDVVTPAGVAHVDAPAGVRLAGCAGPGWQKTLAFTGSAPPATDTPELMPVVRRDGLLVLGKMIGGVEWSDATGLRTDLYDFSSDQLRLVRSVTWNSPALHGGDQFTLSPDGMRVAWVRRSVEAPLMQRLLRRLLPRLAAKPTSVVSLCIAPVEGGTVRTLGWVDARGDSDDISRLEWLPGSRALCFTCRRGYCTLPVP